MALHAVHSGGDRLQWLKDTQVLATDELDWDVLVDRAAAWREGLALAVVLERTAAVIGVGYSPPAALFRGGAV